MVGLRPPGDYWIKSVSLVRFDPELSGNTSLLREGVDESVSILGNPTKNDYSSNTHAVHYYYSVSL